MKSFWITNMAGKRFFFNLTKDKEKGLVMMKPTWIMSLSIGWLVGKYWDFDVHPTGGMESKSSLIGLLDNPASFYEPEHVTAQLLWFGSGYVAYRFPNSLPIGTVATRLDL